MKRTAMVMMYAVLVSLPLFAQEKPILTTDLQKTSYTLGYYFGSDLKKEEVELDTTIFLKAFKDALSGQVSVLPDSVMNSFFTAFGEEMKAKKAMKAKMLSDQNKKESEDFLAANSKKDSIVTLPSGLQYKILREGTGISPTANDTVVANYRGWFIDGKEFDNSYKRGEPAQFITGNVIPGWTEALKIMKVGSKWELFIPPTLAYGDRGFRNVIGPNSLLIFEVELLDVKKDVEMKKPDATAGKKDAKQPQGSGKTQSSKTKKK